MVQNVGLYRAFVTVMRQRDVVRSLFDDHESAWESLYRAYSEENDMLVASFRNAWKRCQDELGSQAIRPLLDAGDRHRHGRRDW